MKFLVLMIVGVLVGCGKKEEIGESEIQWIHKMDI